MNPSEAIVPHSGMLINELIGLVYRVFDDHDTRILVADEMEVSILIANSNALSVPHFSGMA